jgi:hypothetical protein
MIKALRKLETEGMYLNIIKAIWQTYSQHHYLIEKNWNHFP